MSEPVLEVRDLVAGYEPGVPIVRGASIRVDRGEIVVVLGPNGAGKSSFIKAIAGLVPVSAGRVMLDGRDITAVPAHKMVGMGLAFVPQTENIFPLMSVEDNLKTAGGILKPREAAERIARMYETFPDLKAFRRVSAGNLSGGQRQMLAVARALIVDPKLLVLDEPSAGLSPKFVSMVFSMLSTTKSAMTVRPAPMKNGIRHAQAMSSSGPRTFVLMATARPEVMSPSGTPCWAMPA